jgi:predicted transcriptional regulator
MSTNASRLEADPKRAAEQVFSAHKGEQEWLDAFAEHLDRQRSGQSLARSLSIWGLSQAETARLLGVSRQAIGKWIERGVPAERAQWLGDLAAATDLLVHYLQRDRIAAVVRRPIAVLSGQSLLDLLRGDNSLEMLNLVRAMFDFDRAQT